MSIDGGSVYLPGARWPDLVERQVTPLMSRGRCQRIGMKLRLLLQPGIHLSDSLS
jgi:hypothetical protein